jgi:hypothetical protein
MNAASNAEGSNAKWSGDVSSKPDQSAMRVKSRSSLDGKSAQENISKMIDAVRALDRHGLSEEMLQDPHAAEQHVAHGLMDEGVSDTLERLRGAIDAQLHALRHSIDGAGAPVTDGVVSGLARDLTYRIDKFEHRVLSGIKRNDVQSMRELAFLRASLRPFGKSPERVLNLLPFLVRFGIGLLTQIADASRSHSRALVFGTHADS